MKSYQNYINGRWTAPTSGEYEKVCNPANTDEVLALAPLSNELDVAAAAQAGAAAAPGWAAVSAPQRGRILYKLADLLEASCEELATILTKEEGKTFAESCGEVKHSAVECRFMAGEASRLEGRAFPSELSGGMVCHVKEPLGQIAAINPWNFPVVTPIRKIAPALACGDTVLFKPAASTPGTAVKLMDLFEQAGVPEGVVNLVCGSGRLIGDAICKSPLIDGISFTGSTQVGRHISALAGERMVRIQLEMGGKNPVVVWNPPNMGFCAAEIAKSAFGGAGQKCTAISKVIVRRDQQDELVTRLATHARALVVGDGMCPGVTMGPLASKQQFESVMCYMQIAKRDATVVCGGDAQNCGAPGWFVQPTIVTDVGWDDQLAKEEVFGPFLSIIAVDTFDEAMRAANNSKYGLTSAIFTADTQFSRRFVNEIRSGMTHVNEQTLVMAHVPFGGVKESGFGAYSNGNTAKDFYMTDKTIYFA